MGHWAYNHIRPSAQWTHTCVSQQKKLKWEHDVRYDEISPLRNNTPAM